MKSGRVLTPAPGRSVVRLDTGEVIIARNGLNVRTPPRSRVHVVRAGGSWVVVGRDR